MADQELAKFWKETSQKLASAGMQAYDASVFEKEKLSYEDLQKNESFLRAAAHVYQMKNGESWEAKMAREHLDINSKAAKEKLGNYGVDTIRWFSNNIASTATTAKQVLYNDSTTQDQKVAFLYLMNSYEQTSMSMDGALAFAWQGVATDVSTLGSLAAGALSLGAGAAAGFTAKAATAQGFRLAIKEAVQVVAEKGIGEIVKDTVKQGTEKVIGKGVMAAVTEQVGKKTATMAFARGALPGVLNSTATNLIEQGIKTQQFSIGGSTVSQQNGFSWSSFGTANVQGAVFGGLTGVAGHGLGKGWDKFKGTGLYNNTMETLGTSLRNTRTNISEGASNLKAKTGFSWGRETQSTMDTSNASTTMSFMGTGNIGRYAKDFKNYLLVSASTSGKDVKDAAGAVLGKAIIPDDQHTIVHDIARWNPWSLTHFAWFSRRKRPDVHVPVHISRGAYIKPVINAVDDRGATLISPINDLTKELKGISARLGNSTIDSATAVRESVAAINAFSTAHGTALNTFSNSLNPILVELGQRAPVANKNSSFFNLSRMGLEKRQIEGMQDWVREVNGFSKGLATPGGAFVAEYERQLNALVAANAPAHELVDAINRQFQKPAKFGERAQMRIDFRKAPLGKGVSFYEQIWQQAALEDGYHNPKIRTADDVSLVTSPGKPPNDENFIIFMETMANKKDRKAGKLEFTPTEVGNLAGYIKDIYLSGREYQALYALRHLLWRSGRGSFETVPKDLLKYLNDMNVPNGGEHWNYFLQEVGRVGSNLPHSPLWGAQRHVLDVYTQSTYWFRHGRRFSGAFNPWKPGTWIAAPFHAEWIEKPQSSALKWLYAYPLGGKLVDSADPNEITKDVKFSWKWEKAAADAGTIDKALNWVTGAPSILKIPFRLATMPLYPGYLTTKTLFNASIPGLQPTVIKQFVIGGAGIGAVSWGLNAAGEQFYPEWKKTNATTATVKNASFNSILWAGDKVLAPLRWETAMAKKIAPLAPIFFGDGWNFLYNNPNAELKPEYLTVSRYTDKLGITKNGLVGSSPSTPENNNATPSTPTSGGGSSWYNPFGWGSGSGSGPASTNPNDPAAIAAAAAALKDADDVRAKLQILGNNVTVLRNNLAGRTTAPAWTEEDLNNFKKYNIQQQGLNAKIKELKIGPYFEQQVSGFIFTQLREIGATLPKDAATEWDNIKNVNMLLKPQVAYESYQKWEDAQMAPHKRDVIAWYDGIKKLTNEIVDNESNGDNGWNPERKDRLKKFVAAQEAFAPWIPMMGQKFIDANNRGYNWQRPLVTNEPNNSRVQRILNHDLAELPAPDEVPAGAPNTKVVTDALPPGAPVPPQPKTDPKTGGDGKTNTNTGNDGTTGFNPHRQLELLDKHFKEFVTDFTAFNKDLKAGDPANWNQQLINKFKTLVTERDNVYKAYGEFKDASKFPAEDKNLYVGIYNATVELQNSLDAWFAAHPNSGVNPNGTNTDPATGRTRGPRLSMGEHWDNMVDAFTSGVAIEGDDHVTQFTNGALGFVGSAAGEGVSFLKNTFNGMKRKPGSRAVLVNVESGVAAFSFMALVGGPMLDKMGIGKIPVVGGVLKLALLVVAFMAARKAFDSIHDPAPAQSTGELRFLPSSITDKTSTFNNQLPAGGTPRDVKLDVNDADKRFLKMMGISDPDGDGKYDLAFETVNGQKFNGARIANAVQVDELKLNGAKTIHIPLDLRTKTVGGVSVENIGLEALPHQSIAGQAKDFVIVHIDETNKDFVFNTGGRPVFEELTHQ